MTEFGFWVIGFWLAIITVMTVFDMVTGGYLENHIFGKDD